MGAPSAFFFFMAPIFIRSCITCSGLFSSTSIPASCSCFTSALTSGGNSMLPDHLSYNHHAPRILAAGHVLRLVYRACPTFLKKQTECVLNLVLNLVHS